MEEKKEKSVASSRNDRQNRITTLAKPLPADGQGRHVRANVTLNVSPSRCRCFKLYKGECRDGVH